MTRQITIPEIGDESDEVVVIGGARNGNLRGRVEELGLTPDDFSNGANAALWRVHTSLDRQGLPGDYVQVVGEARRLGLLGVAGMDAAYLMGLESRFNDYATTPLAIQASVSRLKAQRQARRGVAIMVGALNRLGGADGLKTEGIAATLDAVRSDLGLLERGIDDLGTYTGADMLGFAMDIINRDPNAPFNGVPLGIPSLDSGLGGGIANGELAILMARPGHGKTAMLINSLASLVMAGGSAGLISLEMTAPEITRRMLACAAPARMSAMKAGSLTPEEKEHITQQARALFDRQGGIMANRELLTIGQIERQTRRWRRGGGIQALYVDYAQIVRLDAGRRQDSKTAVVDEVVNRLKALALELNIPVIVAAQAKRETDKEADRNFLPGMGDASDCSTIEKAANVIITLSQPHRYDANKYPANEAWALIAKQRDGQNGAIKLGWTGRHVLFHELAEEEYRTCSEQAEQNWREQA